MIDQSLKDFIAGKKTYTISNKSKKKILTQVNKVFSENIDFVPTRQGENPDLEELLNTFTKEEMAIIDKYCKDHYENTISAYNIESLLSLSTRNAFIKALKTKRTSSGGTEATKRGLISEDFIYTALLDVIPKENMYQQCTLVEALKFCGITKQYDILTECPHLINCHIDLLVKLKTNTGLYPILFELKSTRNEIPKTVKDLNKPYQYQVQAYLFLTGLEKAYVLYTQCNDIEGKDLKIELVSKVKCIPIVRDEEKIKEIKNAIILFWQSILGEIKFPDTELVLKDACDNIYFIQENQKELKNKIALKSEEYQKSIEPLVQECKALEKKKNTLLGIVEERPSINLLSNSGYHGMWEVSRKSTRTEIIDEDAIKEKYKKYDFVVPSFSISKTKMKKNKMFGKILQEKLVRLDIHSTVSVVSRVKKENK